MSYEGKQLNVVRNGTTEKELIKRELKTKGIVRTEEGNEYAIDEIYKRGRGIFVEVKGKGGARAKTKPAPAPKQTPAVKEVTIADVEGKKIDGREVVKVQRSAKKVKLEDGTLVDLADIRRVGRGFTADLPAIDAAPKAKTGGARAKVKAEVSEEVPPLAKLKGKTVVINGEEETVERVFKSGKLVTDAGTEFQYDELEINDGVLSIPADEEEYDEELELDEDYSVPELVDMKGETIQIDGEEFKVSAVAQKSGRLKLDNGDVVDYSDVQADETDGSLFIETDRPAIVPKRTVASVVPGRMPVDVFDAETGADIADVVETSAREAISKLYKTELITSIAVVDNQYLCVGLYFAADGVSAKEIAAKIAEIRKSHSVAPTTVVENEEPELEDEEELEDELDDELDEELEDELDEEQEEQDEYGLDFEDDSEDEEELEEETESDVDFEFDDAPEDGPDYEALVENSVDALKTMFNVNAEAFVLRWFESEEVEQSIGLDILPGITTLEQGKKEYVLMGLDDKGNIVVVETQKSSAGKLVRLNGVTMATLSRMEIVE